MQDLEKVYRSGVPAVWPECASAPFRTEACDWLYRAVSLVAVILLSPVFLLVAAAVVFDDGLPVFYRQNRVGKRNRLFQLLKFRSMRNNNTGPVITAAADPRITRAGAVLRKYKLDELPQLWNVVRGEMSLVGPRPEVPGYVNADDPRWRQVLQVRPGLTDLATLVYRNEEQLLAAASDPEQYYREVILPDKLHLNLCYLRSRTLLSDLRLILVTVRFSFLPAGFDAAAIRRTFASDFQGEL